MNDKTKHNLTKIGNILTDSMDEGFLGLAREMLRVFEVWEEAVGSYNASKARPESVKNGRLTIVVESSVWIDHYTYLKDQFVENMNNALGGEVIREITFKVGDVKSRKRNTSETLTKRNAPPKPKSCNPAEVQMAVKDVNDPELKQALSDFLSLQSGPRKE